MRFRCMRKFTALWRAHHTVPDPKSAGPESPFPARLWYHSVLTSLAAIPSPTRQDYRRVVALAMTSALALAAIACLYLFVPPSLAPRVNIRWADEVSDTARTEIERQLELAVGEHVEGTTWAYDLADPSSQAIAAIVTHPFVADTHHIDRARRIVSDETRLGTTRIRGGLSLWRDGPIVPWLGRLAASFLVVSGLWFATTGRPALGRLGRKWGRPRRVHSCRFF